MVYCVALLLVPVVWYMRLRVRIMQSHNPRASFGLAKDGSTRKDYLKEERKVICNQYLRFQRHAFFLAIVSLGISISLVSIVLARVTFGQTLDFSKLASCLASLGSITVSAGAYKLFSDLSNRLEKLLLVADSAATETMQ